MSATEILAQIEKLPLAERQEIAELVMEKYGKSGMTARDMLRLLLDNALDLGPPGVDNTYGYGLANVKFLTKL